MDSLEIISLVVTLIGVASFSAIFTILYGTYSKSTIHEMKLGVKDVEIIGEVIYERQDKIKKRKKRNKILRNVAFYLMLLVVIPIFIFSVINRITKNTTMIGDRGIIVVASGSMSERNKANKYLDTYNLNNQFNTYDIIMIEKVSETNMPKVHDVIAFRNDEGINVIHRIREIKRGADGIHYITRGDSNDKDDTYQPVLEDIIGIYTSKRISGIGAFIMFFQSYAGIITVVSVLYCMIMIDRMSHRINKVQEARVKLLEELIDYSEETNIDKFFNEFTSVVYYKGKAYYFDKNGFVKAEDADEALYTERLKEEVVEKTTKKKKIKIDEEQGEQDED